MDLFEAFKRRVDIWKELHHNFTAGMRELAGVLPATSIACEAPDRTDAAALHVVRTEDCYNRLSALSEALAQELDTMEALQQQAVQRATEGGAEAVSQAAVQRSAKGGCGATTSDYALWMAAWLQMYQDDWDLKCMALSATSASGTAADAASAQALAVACAAQPGVDDRGEEELIVRAQLASIRRADPCDSNV